jgi:hypothetical protein
MEIITLERFMHHPKGTLGVLHLPDHSLAPFYTVERPWLHNRRFESCIPEGAYILAWRKSPKFGWGYELSDVRGRDHILIHAANYPEDVQGCIGIGESLMGNKVAVGRSRDALRRFHSLTEEKQWVLQIVFAKFASTPSP